MKQLLVYPGWHTRENHLHAVSWGYFQPVERTEDGQSLVETLKVGRMEGGTLKDTGAELGMDGEVEMFLKVPREQAMQMKLQHVDLR